MRFGLLQLAWFEADDGACSIVTETEVSDPQITLDQYEKEVVAAVYPDDTIFHGSRKSGGTAALREFYSHSDGQRLLIPFVFPKPGKNELRLYNSQQSGFSPNVGDVWFIYRRQHRLYVGNMPEADWRSLGTVDPDDGAFQLAIQNGLDTPVDFQIPNRSTSLVSRYARNPALSRAALERTGFCCEYDPATSLFISRRTNTSYVEAHHLVPLSATDRLGRNLDMQENIVALAPHWHRAIHHAKNDLVITILDTLIQKRQAFLDSVGVRREHLLEFYGCGVISRYTAAQHDL